jgi:transforming growth factor-beta-induced protein
MRARVKTHLAVALAAATFIVAGCSDDDDTDSTSATTEAEATATTMAGESGGAEAGDIVATATAAGDFTVLLEAATAAGLVDELQGADVVTRDGKTATTLNGADVSVSVKDGKVFLNEDTEVVTTDVMASNGIIHVIDAVLLPPA